MRVCVCVDQLHAVCACVRMCVYMCVCMDVCVRLCVCVYVWCEVEFPDPYNWERGDFWIFCDFGCLKSYIMQCVYLCVCVFMCVFLYVCACMCALKGRSGGEWERLRTIS